MAEEKNVEKLCQTIKEEVVKEDVKKDGQGYAPIKKEFLATDHKRQLAVEFLPDDVAQELSEKIESAKKAAEDPVERPKKKAVKLHGRNRNNQRPIFKAAQSNVCLFAARGFDGECPFGETCKNRHDLAAAMTEREKDLPGSCYLFQHFGRCKFGMLCRYGSEHLKEDGQNIVNEEKWSLFKNEQLNFNELTKDLQHTLRKRKCSFPKTENSKTAYKKAKMEEKMGKAKETESAEAETETLVKEPRLGMDADRTTDERKIKVKDMLGRRYLSPLTTLGNLPFRRVCTEYGAEVTCGEMAMTGQLLQGHAAEWALLRRHASERCFGVQLCGGNPDMMARCAELITEKMNVDFIDINAACPIDLVCRKGEGAALVIRPQRLYNVIRAMRSVTELPISVKLRTGIDDNPDHRFAHSLIPPMADAGADFVAIHGRTRNQRYTKLADWDYLDKCGISGLDKSFHVFGVGDTLSFEDYHNHLSSTNVGGVVVARGALIKPWIFTEIAEKRHWDISSTERFEMLRRFTNYGLEHWGSDTRGVETTRRFLLEWQSFLCRYIPVGLLEVVPQRINERPPTYYGRNELETLMASQNCADWIKISQMLLGPVPEGFSFLPKHKANAYQ